MKDFLMRHKVKITTLLTVILVFFLLLFLKSCQKTSTTKNWSHYLLHITTSLDDLEADADQLLDYFEQVGARFIDCDEDVGNQIKAFSQKFAQDGAKYESLTYNGTQDISGADVYHQQANIYKNLGKELDNLATAIHKKDKIKVQKSMDTVKSIYKELGGNQ